MTANLGIVETAYDAECRWRGCVLKGTRKKAKHGDGPEIGKKDILHTDHFLVHVGSDRLDQSVGNEAPFSASVF